MLLFLSFIALPLIFFVLLMRFRTINSQVERLIKHGIEVDARVLMLWQSESREGAKYWVDYEFKVADRSYRNRLSIAKDEFEQLAIGDKLSITYLKGNPSLSSLTSTLRK
jgi:hypothetical protein